MRFHKLFFYLIVILILTPTTFYSTPQEVFGRSFIAFDNSDISLAVSDTCVINALDVAIGDVVIVSIGDGGFVTPVPTISDENTHTWIEQHHEDNGSIFAEQYMFYTVITTANIANDITVTWTDANRYMCAGAVYSGVDNVNPIVTSAGNLCDNVATCAVAITPASVDNIMVGGCQSDWDSAHTQTFDSTATGTERHELTNGGGDKMGMSTIDMFTFTDATQKDWTCDHAQSGRDLSVIMVELQNQIVNPIDSMTITELLSLSHRNVINPITMTDDLNVLHTKNVPLLFYYEEDTTCTSPISVNTDIMTITDGTEFDFQDGRSYLIIATTKFNSLDVASSEEIRMLHGSTEFEGSAMNLDPQSGTSIGCVVTSQYYPYTWFTVWEPTGAEATENIILQAVPSVNDMMVSHSTITVIEISEIFTKNTDWFYQEQTTDNNLVYNGVDTVDPVEASNSTLSVIVIGSCGNL